MSNLKVPILMPSGDDLPFMPRFPGVGLFYPGGAPMRMEHIRFNSVPLEDVRKKFHRRNVGEGPELTSTEMELLRQYLVYYVHAPIFNMTVEMEEYNRPLRMASMSMQPGMESINEFIDKAMDYGLDPF